MTSISATGFDFSGSFANRSPRISFGARLAALQERREHAPQMTALAGMAARGAMALVPFLGLAWVFVTV